VQLLADAPAHLLCKLSAFRHRDAAHRDEGDDVYGADPGMCTRVAREIDGRDCCLRNIECRVGNCLRLSGKSDDAPVVIGVRLHVQQLDSGAPDHARNGPHLGRVPAFTDVGNTLYDLIHPAPRSRPTTVNLWFIISIPLSPETARKEPLLEPVMRCPHVTLRSSPYQGRVCTFSKASDPSTENRRMGPGLKMLGDETLTAST